MAADVHFLQPTNNTIVSYAMHGVSYDTPIPEWRIVASTPWTELWQGLNPLMIGSCMGLMSNQTALDKLKVTTSYLIISSTVLLNSTSCSKAYIRCTPGG